MMARLVALLACFVWLAHPAAATPDRVTYSEDRMVAATQTHLYVLRDVVDNTGSYFQALHDQHLIEISLDSGEATRFWPLRRLTVSNLETDDYLFPGKVTERTGEIHDMNAVLREVGAEPLVPETWTVKELSVNEAALMRDGERVLTPFGVRAAGRAQLAILRGFYPPIDTEAEYRRAERIDFYNLFGEGDWDCELRPEGQTLYRARDSILIAKLRCEDYDLSGAWSFHIIIPERTEN